MYPHRIRLLGPWQVEPLARRAGDDRPLPPPLRMTMPGRWRDGGLADFAGRVRLRRRFGYPGRIDAHERVWLTCAGVAGTAVVAVNGRTLGTLTGDGAYDVTGLLRERNELTMDLEGGGDGGVTGEVALEVRATASLAGIRLAVEADHLVVRGLVVGTADGPLDLYLIADRTPAGYAAVEASGAGTEFELTAPLVHESGAAVGRIKVELVCAATVWYTVEYDLAAGERSPTR